MSKRKSDPTPAILNGKYFEIVETESNGNVTAKCCDCEKNIKGSLKSTSNFTTHLQHKHPEKLAEYKTYRTDVVSKRKPEPRLGFPVVSRISTAQQKADNLFIDFMIDTMSPISVIENPAFRKLVNGIIQITMGSGSVVSVPTRKTIVTRIRDMYLAKTLEIDKLLSQQKWICATADIWSSSHRSFLGVTCHYIDVVEPFDFQRKSFVLCLKRFQGRHTADKIAEILTTVFSSYKIQDKVAAVVTDNASNFAKAFAEYGYKFSNGDEEDVLEEENSEESSDGGTISDGILEHEDLTTVLQSSCSVDLPSHVRCASHTISLIATTDFEKQLDVRVPRNDKVKTNFKQILRSTMGKCASFWNKSSRSIQVAEQVKAEIGCCVITPVKTRWNSTYDSVKQLAEHIEKLDIIFDIADKNIRLKSLEKEFLMAYKEVVGPVAWALDKLQGENNMFFGYLAPVIHQAKSKLDSFSASESALIPQLAAALITGFQQRYSKILNLDLKEAFNEIMSAISLPQFKLWWIGDPESKERCKAAFITEAKKYESCAAAQSCIAACEADACNDDDLFDFQKELAKTPTTQENAELECIRYLSDTDRSLQSLENYPRIASMCQKLNTVLPSSAPAERLFSYGKMIMRPQRARLTDEHFEMLTLLKLNKLD